MSVRTHHKKSIRTPSHNSISGFCVRHPELIFVWIVFFPAVAWDIIYEIIFEDAPAVMTIAFGLSGYLAIFLFLAFVAVVSDWLFQPDDSGRVRLARIVYWSGWLSGVVGAVAVVAGLPYYLLFGG